MRLTIPVAFIFELSPDKIRYFHACSELLAENVTIEPEFCRENSVGMNLCQHHYYPQIGGGYAAAEFAMIWEFWKCGAAGSRHILAVVCYAYGRQQGRGRIWCTQTISRHCRRVPRGWHRPTRGDQALRAACGEEWNPPAGRRNGRRARSEKGASS